MARYAGTTKERGLGSDHQADRRRLLALHHDGDPCWRCGRPMYESQGLDRDHVIDRALGGANGPAVLAHASCNRSAGATLGNKLQPRTVKAAGDTVCKTCRQPYHYAGRICGICGAHYHPSRGVQYTCSRACGIIYRFGIAARPANSCACGNPSGRSTRCAECVTAAARLKAEMLSDAGWEARVRHAQVGHGWSPPWSP